MNAPDPTSAVARDASARIARRGAIGGDADRAFGRALERADAEARTAAAHEAAVGLVSSALIMPLLGQLSGGPFMSERFAAGAAERRFQPMLHRQLADRIAATPRFPLVDLVRDRLLGRHAEVRA